MECQSYWNFLNLLSMECQPSYYLWNVGGTYGMSAIFVFKECLWYLRNVSHIVISRMSTILYLRNARYLNTLESSGVPGYPVPLPEPDILLLLLFQLML